MCATKSLRLLSSSGGIIVFLSCCQTSDQSSVQEVVASNEHPSTIVTDPPTAALETPAPHNPSLSQTDPAPSEAAAEPTNSHKDQSGLPSDGGGAYDNPGFTAGNAD